jgi:hypothetical protein
MDAPPDSIFTFETWFKMIIDTSVADLFSITILEKIQLELTFADNYSYLLTNLPDISVCSPDNFLTVMDKWEYLTILQDSDENIFLINGKQWCTNPFIAFDSNGEISFVVEANTHLSLKEARLWTIPLTPREIISYKHM